MTALLEVCTKEDQRAVFRILRSEGATGAKIHQRLWAQYGNSVLPQRSVYDWIEKFKNGRTSVTHGEGAGRTSTAKNVVLLYYNIRPHTAAYTAEMLRKLKFKVMAHLPYSPDLSPI